MGKIYRLVGEDPAPPQQWLRVTEAAHLLGVSAKTLRRWEDAGRIRGERSAGGHRRFAVGDLRALQDDLHDGPRVRSAPLPGQPLPALAELLEHHAGEPLHAARHRIYPPDRPGWFASRRAAAPLATWLSELAAACRSGGYDDALRASRALWRAAMSPGYDVEPVECDAFLLLLGPALLRALSDAGHDAEVPDARRLLTALHRSLLEELVPRRHGTVTTGG